MINGLKIIINHLLNSLKTNLRCFINESSKLFLDKKVKLELIRL